MTALNLAGRVVSIDGALSAVAHAFGGALALAYYAEPRATIDIDVNVFVPPDQLDQVLAPLVGLGVNDGGAQTAALIRRDGQARLWWEATPVDLFFAYDPFHLAAAKACRSVPFATTTIPILGPEHLMVCKAVFDRPKDWVDIESMLGAGDPLDAEEVLAWVARIAGLDDARYRRLVRLLHGGGRQRT